MKNGYKNHTSINIKNFTTQLSDFFLESIHRYVHKITLLTVFCCIFFVFLCKMRSTSSSSWLDSKLVYNANCLFEQQRFFFGEIALCLVKKLGLQLDLAQ